MPKRSAKVTDQDGFTVLVELESLEQPTKVPGLGKVIKNLYGEKRTSKSCPYCGWTAQQAVKTGLFGCGVCYTVLYNAWQEAGKQAAANEPQVSSDPT